MQAHFTWQLAFLLHGQPCATASSTVPGSEPFLFLFFSAVFFLCVQVRIVISQTKKEKKRETEKHILCHLSLMCCVFVLLSQRYRGIPVGWIRAIGGGEISSFVLNLRFVKLSQERARSGSGYPVL